MSRIIVAGRIFFVFGIPAEAARLPARRSLLHFPGIAAGLLQRDTILRGFAGVHWPQAPSTPLAQRIDSVGDNRAPPIGALFIVCGGSQTQPDIVPVDLYFWCANF